jgi:hypothetical protein
MNDMVSVAAAAQLLSLFKQVTATFEPALPKAGADVAVSVDVPGIADGTQVQVMSAGSNDAWQVRKQTARVADGVAAFRVKAKRDITGGIDGYEVPLSVRLQMTIEGEKVDARSTRLQPSSATLQGMVPIPEPVAIAHLGTAPAVDGELGEWDAVTSLPLPYMKEKGSGVRMGWNEQGLFGCYRMRDSSVSADTASPWKADGMELFLDRSLSRGLDLGPHADQIAFCPRPDRGPGPAYARVVAGDNRNTDIGITCAWRPTDDGYALEFFCPADALSPAKLAPKERIGLNFALNDDGEPVAQFYSNKDERDGYRRPITWGVVELAP